MTVEKAIKTIEIAIAEVEWEYPMEYAVAFETAISALKKQIPKKPIQANYIVKINGVDILLDENEFTKCPSCTYKDIEVKQGQKYCHICGQALDWDNIE